MYEEFCHFCGFLSVRRINRAFFSTFGTADAWRCVLLYLQPTSQHSPFVWNRGHTINPIHFTLFWGHNPWKVPSQVLSFVILNSSNFLKQFFSDNFSGCFFALLRLRCRWSPPCASVFLLRIWGHCFHPTCC